MFYILHPGAQQPITTDLVSSRIVYAPIFRLRSVSLSFSILPLGGKLFIQDQVSGRIAYAPIFGLRAVSLCTFFLRAVNLLY